MDSICKESLIDKMALKKIIALNRDLLIDLKVFGKLIANNVSIKNIRLLVDTAHGRNSYVAIFFTYQFEGTVFYI